MDRFANLRRASAYSGAIPRPPWPVGALAPVRDSRRREVLTERERDALRNDLAGYRRLAADLRRAHSRWVDRQRNWAEDARWERNDGDFDAAKFSSGMANDARNEAERLHEQRAALIATIRELEDDLTG